MKTFIAMKLKWIKLVRFIRSAKNPSEGRELVLDDFRSGKFLSKTTQGEITKIITPKQMLQRLTAALGQVKSENTSDKSLSEIRQIVYSLDRLKEIIKKVCSIIIKSIQI